MVNACFIKKNKKLLDGSLKKKQAEQQAAKVALQSLSGLLNCRSLANAGDNWKGFLKECLDAINLPQPDYAFTKGKVCTSQEAEVPTTGEDNSQSEFELIYIKSKFLALQCLKRNITLPWKI